MIYLSHTWLEQVAQRAVESPVEVAQAIVEAVRSSQDPHEMPVGSGYGEKR
jgi:hypothetical protein